MKRIVPIGACVVMTVLAVVIVDQSTTIEALSVRVDTLESRAASASKPSTSMELGETIFGLESRLASLEAAQAASRGFTKSLEREVVNRRPRPMARPSAQNGDDDRVADEVSSLREDVDALLTGAGVDSKAAKLQIEKLVALSRDKAQAERRERWQKVMAEHHSSVLKTFSEDEGLDEATRTRLQEMLDQSRRANENLRKGFRDGDISFAQLREGRQKNREATRTSMAEYLDDAQLDRLREALSRHRWRGGGPL